MSAAKIGPNISTEKPQWPIWKLSLLCALAYILFGRLALLLAIPPGYASAIFPPAGIAVAAVFISGKRALPGIFIGSFILNLWIGFDSNQQLNTLGSVAAALIALASVIQAMLGGVLLRRIIGYPAPFDNIRDVLLLQLLTPVICLTSASLSVSCLVLLGLMPSSGFLSSWLMWWVGDSLGMLVLVPLTMVVAGAPRMIWRKRFSTIAIPMIFAFAMLVVLYINVSRWEVDQSLVEFRLQSQRVADAVQAKFEQQESLLEQMHGLFASDANVDAEEFQQFTEQALKRFPMIQAIEWAPSVRASERQQFETMQQIRIPGFVIRERDSKNVIQVAGDRPLYYPITFVAPQRGNEKAFGFDVASNPLRAETIAKTIRTGKSATTPPIRLMHLANHPHSLLLLHAIHQARAGDGVVLIAIRTEDFLNKLLQQDANQLGIRLVDTGTAKVVYNTFSGGDSAPLWQQKLIFGQRVFLLETAPGANYQAQHRGWESALVLAAGLLGIGLLGAFLMLGTGYTARVEAQVKEAIAELSENSEKLTGLYQLSPLGIALTDMSGHYIEFNSAFERICGYSSDELKRLDYWTLTPQKYAEGEAAQLDMLMQCGRYGPYEKEYLRKDGSLIPISLNGLLLTGRDGKQYIWSIVEDISERKRTDAALRDSEARWQFALEGAGAGVWDWNLQTGELFLSKREMEVLGYTGEEAQHTHIDVWAPRQHPLDREKRKAAFEEYLSGSTSAYTYEFRTRTREGSWKWISARGILVSRTADGLPLRMIGTHTDINEYKRHQSQEVLHSTVMELLANGTKLPRILDLVVACLAVGSSDITYAIFSYGDEAFKAVAGGVLPNDYFVPRALPELDMAGGVALSQEQRVEKGIANTDYQLALNQLAQSVQLTPCWSEPIYSGNGVLEAVLVSFRHQGEDSLPDLELQQQAANLISSAVMHKRVEEQLLLANSVYTNSSEGILVVDAQNRIIAINPSFKAMTGYQDKDVIGLEPRELLSEQESAISYQERQRIIRDVGKWSGEIRGRHKDGSDLFIMMSVNSIYDESGTVTRRVAILSDIRAKKVAEEQIKHLAHHDALTGLPNRLLFADRLTVALTTAHRNQTRLAVLYIDLDHFKPVNDGLGHAIGDLLLKQVAQRMIDSVRGADTVARIGGDEFVVLLPSIQTLESARRVAENIRTALANSFEVEGHHIQISSSIGVAVYPDHAEEEKHLMLRADQAMYLAKKAGRDVVCMDGGI